MTLLSPAIIDRVSTAFATGPRGYRKWPFATELRYASMTACTASANSSTGPFLPSRSDLLEHLGYLDTVTDMVIVPLLHQRHPHTVAVGKVSKQVMMLGDVVSNQGDRLIRNPVEGEQTHLAVLGPLTQPEQGTNGANQPVIGAQHPHRPMPADVRRGRPQPVRDGLVHTERGHVVHPTAENKLFNPHHFTAVQTRFLHKVVLPIRCSSIRRRACFSSFCRRASRAVSCTSAINSTAACAARCAADGDSCRVVKCRHKSLRAPPASLL